MSQRSWLIALACVAIACTDSDSEPDPVEAPFEVSSSVVCSLVGKDAHNPATLQPELQIYGTDLGIPVEIGERMFLLFGDTWTRPLCEGTDEPYVSLRSDDLLGLLEPEPDADACLAIEFDTLPDDSSKFQPMRLEHGGKPVDLLALGVASTAFAYQDELYAVFNPYAELDCKSDGDCAAPSVCAFDVCTYQGLPIFPPRILAKSATRADRPSGEFTGFAELAAIDFTSVTVHTVNRLTDYANDAPSELLVFGRRHYLAGLNTFGIPEPPALFLFRQPLASLVAEQRLSPQYFAGFDDDSQPRWSDDPARAIPVTSPESEIAALDGQEQPVPILFPGSMAVSTIPKFGAQGFRWLLVYGGRAPVGVDFYETDRDPRLGLFFRLARDPWGPWTAPRRLWSAYDPDGPSVVYRPNWKGVVSDEGRGPRSCDAETPYEDIGVEYSPQVIERFSQVDGDRLTIRWLMSIWNPYRVIQMRSEITLRD